MIVDPSDHPKSKAETRSEAAAPEAWLASQTHDVRAAFLLPCLTTHAQPLPELAAESVRIIQVLVFQDQKEATKMR